MGKDRQIIGGSGGWPKALEFGLEDLPPDGLTAAFTLEPGPAGELLNSPGGCPPELNQPLAGELGLQPLSGGWLVSGRILAGLKAKCDYCLADYTQRLEISFQEPVKVAKAAAAPGQDAGPETSLWDSSATDDDFFLLLEKSGRVNLWPLVAEQFWLAWPQNFRCRPDCRGLCPECGADLNQADCGCRAQNAAARAPGFEILKKVDFSQPG